jgi:hypothetical protein
MSSGEISDLLRERTIPALNFKLYGNRLLFPYAFPVIRKKNMAGVDHPWAVKYCQKTEHYDINTSPVHRSFYVRSWHCNYLYCRQPVRRQASSRFTVNPLDGAMSAVIAVSDHCSLLPARRNRPTACCLPQTEGAVLIVGNAHFEETRHC